MFTGINNILFATNLTRDCIPAFDAAVILALKFRAKILLLHVIEKIPDYVGTRLEGLLGKSHYDEILRSYENDARQTLIGKRSSSKLIQNVLERLCTEAGVDDATRGYESREVVIGEGDIADCILDTSQKNACDLIILGGHTGVLPTKTIGTTLKTVLKKSKIPVLVVPKDPNLQVDVPYASGLRQ